MTRQEITALVASQERAFGQRDLSALTAPYAPDAVLESRLAGTVHGAAGIGQVYLAWFAAFPDVTLTTDEVLIDGDQVVWLVTQSGTDTGGFMGLPPSGKSFTVPMVLIYTLEHDKVIRERRIYDFTGMLIQIGVLKPRPV
jgi:steroid delta-isomerase-like uncharacterized protein